MRRYLPALLVVVSAGIIAAGLLELNTREDGFSDLGFGDDEPSALATPSPTPFGGLVSTPSPTPAETLPLTPAPDGTTGATGTQETPVPAAEPTPASDVGGVTGTQAQGEPMPVTGGGAVTGGLLVMGVSGLAGVLARLRLR